MPKARSAAEKRKFAEENGYTGDIHTVDKKVVPRGVLPYTEGQYDWRKNNKLKGDLFRKDGTIASPHCLQSLKLFAEFTGTSTPGLLDPNGKATVQTVRNHFRCFASGWNLKNPDSIIPRHLYDSITNDIKTRIKLKIGLSELNRTKTFLTLENFMYLERQLWENDSHDYVHASHACLRSLKQVTNRVPAFFVISKWKYLS
ncbi:hypothetical protein B0T24DRAFT_599721 [Lasiosphaeria ovina]|uniref:Uncharacterized protein n=1 Tax=Lasiosphaeria ovina TaxID=92902 RepID=A0AAE0JSH6_9PEZI|nr:hypothetical protein B0T24DRAFT_599721 [Lasiosphaeria ovina]